MKKTLLATAIAFLSTSTFAETPDGAKKIYANVTEVTYIDSITANGGVSSAKTWHGTRTIKLKDGSCLQIVRSDFKLLKGPGDLQLPAFKESQSAVTCPSYSKPE